MILQKYHSEIKINLGKNYLLEGFYCKICCDKVVLSCSFKNWATYIRNVLQLKYKYTIYKSVLVLNTNVYACGVWLIQSLVRMTCLLTETDLNDTSVELMDFNLMSTLVLQLVSSILCVLYSKFCVAQRYEVIRYVPWTLCIT